MGADPIHQRLGQEEAVAVGAGPPVEAGPLPYPPPSLHWSRCSCTRNRTCRWDDHLAPGVLNRVRIQLIHAHRSPSVYQATWRG